MKYLKSYQLFEYNPGVYEIPLQELIQNLLLKKITRRDLYNKYYCAWQKLNVGRSIDECDPIKLGEDPWRFNSIYNNYDIRSLIVSFDKRPITQKRYDLFVHYVEQGALIDYFQDVRPIDKDSIESIRLWFRMSHFYSDLIYYIAREEVSEGFDPKWADL